MNCILRLAQIWLRRLGIFAIVCVPRGQRHFAGQLEAPVQAVCRQRQGAESTQGLSVGIVLGEEWGALLAHQPLVVVVADGGVIDFLAGH